MPRESISLVRRGTLIYSASVHLAMAIHRCMDDTVDLTDLSEQAQYAVKQALADRLLIPLDVAHDSGMISPTVPI